MEVPISNVPEFVFAFPKLLFLKKIPACVKTSTQQLALSRDRESFFAVIALSRNLSIVHFLGTDDLKANDLKLRFRYLSVSFNINTGEIHLCAKYHVAWVYRLECVPLFIFPCSLYLLLSTQFSQGCCESLQRWNKFAEVLPAPPVRRTGYLCSFCVKGALFLCLLCSHRSKDFIFNLSLCDVLRMKCFMTSCGLRNRLWWSHENV